MLVEFSCYPVGNLLCFLRVEASRLKCTICTPPNALPLTAHQGVARTWFGWPQSPLL